MMAVLLEVTLPGVAPAMGPRLEHALNEGVEHHDRLAEELVALLVKPQRSGLRLAVVWRSDAAARTFHEQVLVPRLTALGMDAPDDPALTPIRLA